MSAEKPLWGTFSVADHRRQRPFISDVLLYDLLVVPVPDGDDEMERWRKIGREPDRQKDLLAIIDDLALAIPWRLTDYPGLTDRYRVAQAIEADVGSVALGRRLAQEAGADPDHPNYLLTRMVLADVVGSRQDRALVARIPRADEVEAVVAFGSYSDFESDSGALAKEAAPGSQPVFTFGWSFFVPASSERTDDDLLREAVLLAHTGEVSAWRAAVQRWRRDSFLKGESDAEALREMEELIAEYREAARKMKIRVRARWGFAVAAALAGSAAVFVPPVGVAALFGLGSLLPSRDIPERLEAAAMFHEARRRFG